MDIRADGGYVVAPPSVHASGALYEWQFTPGLDGWDALAEYQLKEASEDGSPLACSGFDLSGVNTLLTTAPVEPGQRNVTLARLAGQWLAQGMEAETCLLAALGWNSTLSSPLPPEEVRRTVDSVCRRKRAIIPRERQCRLPSNRSRPQRKKIPDGRSFCCIRAACWKT